MISNNYQPVTYYLIIDFCDNNFKVFPEIPDSLIKPKTEEL